MAPRFLPSFWTRCRVREPLSNARRQIGSIASSCSPGVSHTLQPPNSLAKAFTPITVWAPGVYSELGRMLVPRAFTSAALVEPEPGVASIIEAKAKSMSSVSKRTGVVAVKCGMTALWDRWGSRVPITVLWVDDNQVTQVKTKVKEGHSALQIGAGQKKAKQLSKPELGHFIAQGVPLKRKLVEFRVSEDALMPVGTTINVRHFVPGQYIDVAGITTGKGFQGGMKRWGFSGMPASHGASLSHRSIGSTGGRQDPGKVFKGKKMPGQMGAKRVTMKNVWVYKIDPSRNLMWVKGQVPGHSGNFVELTDAVYKKPDSTILPFPTFFPSPDEDINTLQPLEVNMGESDPFLVD